MTASEHRARAREALRGNWPWAVLTTLVASLLGGISGASVNLDLNLPEMEGISLDQIPGTIQTLLVGVVGSAVVVGIVVGVARMILGGVVGIGYRCYLLGLIDGAEASFQQLFSQFHRLGQAVLLRVLRWAVSALSLLAVLALSAVLYLIEELLALAAFVLILVWCGVMIYVEYSFAVSEFIMAEDEHCGAIDAMKRSWQMMDGNRYRLWCLELSFIGWAILAGFTLGIGGLFLNPYQQVACASFYRELKPRRTSHTAVNDGVPHYTSLPEVTE